MHDEKEDDERGDDEDVEREQQRPRRGDQREPPRLPLGRGKGEEPSELHLLDVFEARGVGDPRLELAHAPAELLRLGLGGGGAPLGLRSGLGRELQALAELGCVGRRRFERDDVAAVVRGLSGGPRRAQPQHLVEVDELRRRVRELESWIAESTRFEDLEQVQLGRLLAAASAEREERRLPLIASTRTLLLALYVVGVVAFIVLLLTRL